MTDLLRWLTNRLALLLDPAERDAVLGDLAEVGATPAGAFAQVLGVVLRRRWTYLLRYSAVAAFFLVFSIGLAGSAVHLIRTSDLWLWIAFESRHLQPAQLVQSAATVLAFYMVLVLHASSAGLTLSTLAPRFLIWTIGLCLLVTWAAMLYASRFSFSPWSAALPTAALALPFLLGIKHGLRTQTFPLRLAVTYAIAIVAFTTFGFWAGGRFRTGGWRLEAIPALLFMNAPILYLNATALRRPARLQP